MGLSISNPNAGGIPTTALDTDPTAAADSDAKVMSQKASKTALDTKQTEAQVTALVDTAIAAIPAGPRVLNDQITEVATADVGVLEKLSSNNFGRINPGVLSMDGQKITCSGMVATVLSATATRDIQIRFASATPNVIWDSGVLTLPVATLFYFEVTLYRIDSTTARIFVRIVTNSASAVPVVTAKEDVVDCDFDNATSFLQVWAIAEGVGAASGDIIFKGGTTMFLPTQ